MNTLTQTQAADDGKSSAQVSGKAAVKAFFDEATFTVSYVVSDPATQHAAIVDSVLFPGWLVNGTRPSRLAWLLKEKILPPLYWKGMLKGREWLARPEMPN